MVPKVSETEIELTTFAPIHLNGSACNSEHSVCEETNDNEPLLLERTDEVRVTRHRLTSQSSLSGDEPWWQIALQVFFPFLVAGFGMVGAGMVLDIVQHWDVFIHVTDVFILVPALLGLKGNLEMTLASRLSTQANLGHVDSRKDQLEIIAGNLALTQAQAVVVGFLAAIAAVVMGWVPNGQFNMDHALLLCASSVVTASLASLVLGSIMIAVVLLSRKCRVNPDNIATPIAASLGDLTTLGLLASVTSLLYNLHDSQKWVAPLIIAVFILSIPLWVFISHRNKFVHDVLYDGWEPVIAAMMISSVGGLVLDYTVLHYDGIAVFQPVINGVGGNLVAVQASRLATALHQSGMPLGKLPESASSLCPTPCRAFFGKGTGAKAARVLLMMVIPGHLIFIFTITYLHGGHTTTSVKFSAFYLAAALVQVALLLFIASWMVPFAWRRKKDPDNVCIPYLTALGDLIGTALLAVAFYILDVTGDQDTDLGD